MMKVNSIICIWLLSLMVVWSCSKGQEPGGQAEGTVPVTESVSIQDGATGVAVDLGYIDVTYDVPVAVADASAITLSGTEVEVTAMNMKIRILFGDLLGETEYTLTVGKGAVVSRTGNLPAEALTLTFTTGEDRDAPYVPGEPGDYSTTLAVENPLPAADRLYRYLLDIYGRKTLSGAMAHVDWNTDEAEWVGRYTGKYPAIAFFDYIHLTDSGDGEWIDYGDITTVREWWEDGGLVGASWHWNVPVSQGSSEISFNADGNSFSASEAVREGTWENDVVNADLDKLAGYLKLLQAEGIPVLWRPLHEAAGNTYTYNSGAWFWWGADGAAAFRNLWIYVFEYLEKAGVNNLIWVWTTQTSVYEDADYAFYPGDEYVDIVGRDIYNLNDASAIAAQFGTIARMTTHKMVTFSELGGVPDMAAQWDAGANWLYFMPWYDYDNDYTEGYDHEHADMDWWKASFASDAVITRDELPANLFE